MRSHDNFDDLVRFYRVQNACVQLRFAAEGIFNEGLTKADVIQMRKQKNNVTTAILSSPASKIASFLKDEEKKPLLSKAFEYYDLDTSGTTCDEFVSRPLLLRTSAADISSIDPDVLKTLGESWLRSIVLLILSQRFRFANGAALDELVAKLFSSGCFAGWSKDDPTTYNLPSFMHYIGALTLDRARGGFQLEEVRCYIEARIQEDALRISSDQHMCRGLYAKNPKFQLIKLLPALGVKGNVKFSKRNAAPGAEITIDVMLDNKCLGSATGPNMSAAEKNAAEVVLKLYPDTYVPEAKVLQPAVAEGSSSAHKPNNSLNKAPASSAQPVKNNTPSSPPKGAKKSKPASPKKAPNSNAAPTPKTTRPPASAPPQTCPPLSVKGKNKQLVKRLNGPPGSLDPSKDGYVPPGERTSRNSNSSSRSNNNNNNNNSSRSGSTSRKDKYKCIMGIKGVGQKDPYTLRLKEREMEAKLRNRPQIDTNIAFTGKPSFGDTDDEDEDSSSAFAVTRINQPTYQRPVTEKKGRREPWRDDPVPAMKPISYEAFVKYMSEGKPQQPSEPKPTAGNSKYNGKSMPPSKPQLRIEPAPVAAAADTNAKTTLSAKSDNITPDKEAVGKLAALVSSKGIGSVEYFTKYGGPGKFRTICRLANDPSHILAECEGKSKSMAEDLAATIALLNENF